uniref:Uncharacterized protein n=1 Tax=Rhizophora mucronata TaxID=61149 RepID=A0A2P2QLB5_RHIMU
MWLKFLIPDGCQLKRRPIRCNPLFMFLSMRVKRGLKETPWESGNPAIVVA